MKKVYVMTLDTSVNSGLKKVLENLGGTVIIADMDRWFWPKAYDALFEIVIVSLCEETTHTNGARLFPGKHLRRMTSFEAAQEKGFSIHPTLTSLLSGQPVTVLVIRTPSLQGLLAPLTQRLYTALEHFHNRDREGRCTTKRPNVNRVGRFWPSGVLNEEWNFCRYSAETLAYGARLRRAFSLILML